MSTRTSSATRTTASRSGTARSPGVFPGRGRQWSRRAQSAADCGVLGFPPGCEGFRRGPKPIPTSFARQAYFAVTAFKFTNAAGQSRFGRFRFRPEAGTEFVSAEQAAQKTSDFLAAELSDRLSRGPARFQVLVQLAEAGDEVTD